VGETVAAQRLPGFAETVGGRTHFFLDRPESPYEMSKDYERLTETGEAFIYVAMSRLMARRLARS
jgi:hypothetical protein